MRIFKNSLILDPITQQKDRIMQLEHDLNSLHVRTLDHNNQKITDADNDFFCFVLCHPGSKRKLYFLD